MNGNIIIAHGMRRGQQNKALETFISELIKDEIHHYHIAFLESEHQDLETVMTTLIQNGVIHFKIVPLLILVQCTISKIYRISFVKWSKCIQV